MLHNYRGNAAAEIPVLFVLKDRFSGYGALHNVKAHFNVYMYRKLYVILNKDQRHL